MKLSLLRVALYIACGLSVLAELVLLRPGDDPWMPIPGFQAIFGFIAFVAIVFAGAKLLRPLVMRDRDYYDD